MDGRNPRGGRSGLGTDARHREGTSALVRALNDRKDSRVNDLIRDWLRPIIASALLYGYVLATIFIVASVWSWMGWC